MDVFASFFAFKSNGGQKVRRHVLTRLALPEPCPATNCRWRGARVSSRAALLTMISRCGSRTLLLWSFVEARVQDMCPSGLHASRSAKLALMRLRTPAWRLTATEFCCWKLLSRDPVFLCALIMSLRVFGQQASMRLDETRTSRHQALGRPCTLWGRLEVSPSPPGTWSGQAAAP